MNVQTAVKEYLANRAAAEAAKAGVAAAEQALKEAFAKAGVTSAIDAAEGVKVSVVQGERPNYDATVLADLVLAGVVDETTFATVTEAKVKGEAFKAARTVGLITDAVAEKVTTLTHYEQVRVSAV